MENLYPKHGLVSRTYYKKRTIDQSAGGKLRDRNAKESWALLEDLALYDNESWNDPRDFAKPVKAIALPQDVPSTSDRRLIELENQVQRLMEAHLALTQPTQVNKITTSCEICSGPHDTQYCMEDHEQAFVEPLRMTKVIKGEFEKLKDLNDEGVSLTCGTSLEVFNKEFNRMSGMDDDLFTYEVEVANIPCDSNKDDDSEQRVLHEANDDTGYDPSDVAFTEWLWSKKFNYKTIDHYRKKALWIYWIRGDDEVELTDKEFSDNEDEVAEVFRIDTNIFNFETPMCKTFKEFNYLLQIDPDLLTKDIEGFKTYEEYKDDWIYEWNKDIPWVDKKPWTNVGVWTEATPVKHYSYIVGNSLHYQDYEWYEALKDSELKEKALRNKAIMKGLISDDESCNDGWRRWESHEITFHDHDEIDYENETYNERQELCETHELQVCNMRRFEMIKYSFGQDEEYAAVKEDKYDDLARTSDDACRAYQEIFRIMDEGWMVTRAK
ncbi:hypothetical protein Tco_0652549 [Tanacetum coccineum]|uniref:MAK10-like protein n=1 Tax=Tanacetum coccineum TaxID=301880 RepID=A0ABQ4WY43_9ASTR